MKFTELYNLLHQKYGIDHLADIARELNVTPQAVSNWKSRDRVPYKYVLRLREKIDEIDNTITKKNEVIINNKSENNIFQEPEDEFISLSDILLLMANHIKLIIIIPTILSILSIIYVLFIAQPLYESTSKIMSSSSGGSMGVSDAMGIAATFGINMPMGGSEPEWAYSEIIKSRTLARSMLKRKFDTEKYGPNKSLLQILTNFNKSSEFGINALEVVAVDNFIGMISLSEDKKSKIFTITISASEPLFSYELNSALIEELDLHQRKYNKEKTSETRQFIEERIVETKKDLENAEEALKNFNDRNRRIENSPALQLERLRLSREVTVLTGVFTTLKQQNETTKIEELKDSDYVIIVDKPEVPIFRSSPQRKRIVIIAGFIGIGLGIFISFIIEYFINSEKEERNKLVKARSVFINKILELLPFFVKRKKS
tara:strand:+ start:634 stop:1923 length:1290 start_codon:yes stop_codon:yes gene_type:complete